MAQHRRAFNFPDLVSLPEGGKLWVKMADLLKVKTFGITFCGGLSVSVYQFNCLLEWQPSSAVFTLAVQMSLASDGLEEHVSCHVPPQTKADSICPGLAAALVPLMVENHCERGHLTPLFS